MSLPRLLVAAPSTGQGKTIIATGLMAAFRAAGHEVSGHKVGPDYIDPGYHALATGRPGRNLDPHLVGEDRIVPLLLHGAAGADLAVIEGVMGLHDGRLGTAGFASTAHVATLTRTPIVLVLDIARMSRSAAAIAAGIAAFDPAVRVAGVVLNCAGSPRNTAEVTRALEMVDLPVFGVLPRDDRLVAPSRHLGLVPAAERTESAATIEHLGKQVATHLDLAALLDVARGAPDLDAAFWDPALELAACFPTGSASDGAGRSRDAARRVEAVPHRGDGEPRHRVVTGPARGGARGPVVAVAGGRAFTFRYAETDELLRAAGCDVVTFDPLTDSALPPGTAGLYLGGGFPEVHAAELAANERLVADIRAAVADGVPTVAECAGLLYLARALDGVPMAGVLPTEAAMTDRLTLRYPDAVAAADSLLTRAGERVTGHEFHRTHAAPAAGPSAAPTPGPDSAVAQPAPAAHSPSEALPVTAATSAVSAAWVIDGEPTGFAGPTLHASYLHVHWAGHPQLAARFATAVHDAARSRTTTNRRPLTSPARAVTSPPTWLAGATPGQVGSDAAASPAALPRLPDPLRHHGDVEAGSGLLDFAVNVFPCPRPDWLDRVLHEAIETAGSYPDSAPARAAIAAHHGREVAEVLPTAGAAEAFALVARARPWRHPVVVHPQFTEPHAALLQAGHDVTTVLCRAEDGFALDPAAVPEHADLVIVGNPTNPTGVLHPGATIRALLRPGRLVVVDEAFVDAVDPRPPSAGGAAAADPTSGGDAQENGRNPTQARRNPTYMSESDASVAHMLVLRSLTKHWTIPGIRAGYVVGDAPIVAALKAQQPPWSVSGPAVAATVACLSEQAAEESRARARAIAEWREVLEEGLRQRGIQHVPSAASFVLARVGAGVHLALRGRGIAVRRADTFPGLDHTWVRIAVRPLATTRTLLTTLDQVLPLEAGNR